MTVCQNALGHVYAIISCASLRARGAAASPFNDRYSISDRVAPQINKQGLTSILDLSSLGARADFLWFKSNLALGIPVPLINTPPRMEIGRASCRERGWRGERAEGG